ncbi:amidase domain-containing protein [Peribacillus sp. SCS-26]|uniref:amidase domain-containing protein n=1 Tax=Paraperibacillus marinus TaxID=3115295 RepID=UPI0039060EF2
MKEQLEQLLQERVDVYISGSAERAECTRASRKLESLRERSAEIVNVKAGGMVKSVRQEQRNITIDYDVHYKYLIKQKELLYLEEEIEHRQAVFEGNRMVMDDVQPVLFSSAESEEAEGEDVRAVYTYNRLKAVQYAERWWNEFNPGYKKFQDDCTNFISQCLRAGGAPVWGQPQRQRGWWYTGKTWSYSWAVAHSLKLYLGRSKGLKTRMVSKPEELTYGDIICYDFEGDGRYNHNTIVTGRDAYGMPLVNAHTTNSRMRYWKYEDSTAYTPRIKYAFFKIVTDS